MKFSIKLLIVFLCVITMHNDSFLFAHATNSPEPATQSKYQEFEITLEEDIHTALTSNKPTVILAYMDHCPHCDALKPFFKEKSLANPKIKFLMINGRKFDFVKKVAQYSKMYAEKELKIPGFPTILFIKDGKIIDHQIGGSKEKFAEKLAKNFK